MKYRICLELNIIKNQGNYSPQTAVNSRWQQCLAQSAATWKIGQANTAADIVCFSLLVTKAVDKLADS